MSQAFARLIALLARLEDSRPYVTLDDLCAAWQPPTEADRCRQLVADALADRRLFADQRHRYDPTTGAFQPVRLVRLNRRHPTVARFLD